MFCRSWSAEKVTGGGGAEVCAIAEDEVPKITIRQVLTSEDLGEKGTRALQSDMICGVSEKLSASGTHAKPFVMKRARAFFVTTGFLIYFGLLAPQLPLAASPALQTWVATWGSSQQIPEPQNELPIDDLRDATLRQIFHLSIGGSALRVHMSNAFGTEALHFTSVHMAHPLSTSSPAIDPPSDQPLTFAGKPDVLVPPGAEFISDSISLKVAALSDLAVTFHLDTSPARQTGHPGSRATSYYVHG